MSHAAGRAACGHLRRFCAALSERRGRRIAGAGDASVALGAALSSGGSAGARARPDRVERSRRRAGAIRPALGDSSDSGAPVLVALDDRGTVVGRVQLTGAAVEDWEAIAVGPVAGSCVYVADIGDNQAARGQITVYRALEPETASGSVPVRDVFTATVPGRAARCRGTARRAGRRDVHRDQGRGRPVALYRFPRGTRSGLVLQLERVGNPRGSGKVHSGHRVTDGAVSPDGAWVASRTSASATSIPRRSCSRGTGARPAAWTSGQSANHRERGLRSRTTRPSTWRGGRRKVSTRHPRPSGMRVLTTVPVFVKALERRPMRSEAPRAA